MLRSCHCSRKTATSIYLATVLLLLFSGAFYPALSSAHEREVLRVTGWDVYADPENKAKTIGYRTFEEKHGVTVEFQPLNNLDDIVDMAESGSDFDVVIVSNEGIQLLHDMQLVTTRSSKVRVWVSPR